MSFVKYDKHFFHTLSC